MTPLLPELGPRDTYVEVYFTTLHPASLAGFSNVLTTARPANPGNAIEKSAELISARVSELTGDERPFFITKPPSDQNKLHGSVYEACENDPSITSCVVTCIVKSDMGVCASSHVESFLEKDTKRPRAYLLGTNGYVLKRGSRTIYSGRARDMSEYSTGWKNSMKLSIGQETLLDVPALMSGTLTSRTRKYRLFSVDMVDHSSGIDYGDGPIRVVHSKSPELDVPLILGKDIDTDILLTSAPTLATAAVAVTQSLVSEELQRRSEYATTDPWRL